MNNNKTKRLVVTAMLCAIAYIAVVCIRIPIVSIDFLKFEPKDVVITIAGFMYGPLSSFIISVVVSFIEMITISSTGPIGLIMNILSSCAFSCCAAAIYKKRHDMYGAAIGLGVGTVAMTAMMLIWNYAITPLYMGMARSDVAAMLIPIFLPFNILKGAINASLTLALYKPAVTVLRKARLVEATDYSVKQHKKTSVGTAIVSLILLATCVIIILAIRGII